MPSYKPFNSGYKYCIRHVMERMLQNTIKWCHKPLSKIFLVLFNSHGIFLWNCMHIEELEKVGRCRFSSTAVKNVRVFHTAVLFEKTMSIRCTLISPVPVTFAFRVFLGVQNEKIHPKVADAVCSSFFVLDILPLHGGPCQCVRSTGVFVGSFFGGWKGRFLGHQEKALH